MNGKNKFLLGIALAVFSLIILSLMITNIISAPVPFLIIPILGLIFALVLFIQGSFAAATKHNKTGIFFGLIIIITLLIALISAI